MAFIRITLEDGTLMDCRLDAKTLTIGRHPENDVILKDPSISSRHAIIKREKDGVWVEDLGSTNKTEVNGEEVDEILLQHRDVLLFGDVRAVFYAGKPDEIGDEPETGVAPAEGLRSKFDKQHPKDLPVAETTAVRLKAEDLNEMFAAETPEKKKQHSRRQKVQLKKKDRGGVLRTGAASRSPLQMYLPRKATVADNAGVVTFLFIMGFIFSAVLGLSVRHWQETGGFLPADLIKQAPRIEVHRSGQEPQQQRPIRGRQPVSGTVAPAPGDVE